MVQDKELTIETNGRNKCEIRFQFFPVKANVYINLMKGKNVTEIKILLGKMKKFITNIKLSATRVL